MTYSIRTLTPEEWKPMAENAHLVLFGDKRSGELNRHHFVLVCFAEGELGGYMTCIEMDSESVYIQYGGVFPTFEKTIHVLQGYGKLVGELKGKYKRCSTRIENKNIPMLKMALHIGFLVTGIHYFEDKVFLELTYEFGR